MTWTDGRNAVADHFQQDVYFAALPAPGPLICTMVENPTTDYTAATHTCALGTPGSVTTACTVDGQPVVAFSRELSVRQVPETWATWSSPPFSESATPIVGFTEGESLLTIDLGANASSLAGFELEPNLLTNAGFPVTAVFVAADGSELGRVTRTVAGQASARLFAADCGPAVISAIDVTIPPEAQGFAVAQVRGNNLPPAAVPAAPPASTGVRAVPAGATTNAQ